MSSENLYVLVEGLGGSLLSLIIHNKDEPPLTPENAFDHHVDPYRVLFHCKALEDMSWITNAALTKSPDSPDLQPEHFKNFKWYLVKNLIKF